MTRQTILIIEDDRDMAELLATNLDQAGYRVLAVSDGEKGLRAVLETHPDLILLDVMLPGMGGTEVCSAVRKNQKLKDIPIIFLTARREEGDRVMGLELGADDYVVKPFSVRELLLRIRAVLRRVPAAEPPVNKTVDIGPLAINTERYEVSLGGDILFLTAIEYKMLLCLAEQAGTVLSRQTLMAHVWGTDHTVELRTVDTHITRLRTKMGENGAMIKAIRGFGYLLEP